MTTTAPTHHHILSTARALLIDLDGVLVDSMPAIRAIFTTWAHQQGLDPAHVARTVHGRPTAQALHDLVAPEHVESHRHHLTDAEIDASHTMNALPGAHDLLRALPTNSWAVVTSGERGVARARLHATGLPTPSVLVSADDVTHGKPHPEPFLHAAALLGVAPETCWVIEDAVSGITAAHAAGMPAIGIGEHLTPECGARTVLTSLTHLRVDLDNDTLALTASAPRA
ncbi:HAD-IA family hydrolase [Nocardia takedensis]|uniref:HAD-IA family hydrolase n=1 Tax=Nocardia takedensis TaxID=259390 RepID=UPI003F7779F8